MAGSSPKTSSSLAALAALKPASSAPASAPSSRPARKSSPPAAGVAAGAEGDDRRLTIRMPDDEAQLLKDARVFLVGQERKAIDGRILLTALRLVKFDAAFLKEYDAFDERDGRSRTSLGKLSG